MSPQEPTGSYMQWHATPSAGYEASNQSPSSSTHPQNPYDSSHGTAVTSYSRSLQPATSGQPYYTAATTPPVYSHRVAQSTPTWPHTSTQSYQTTASTPASHGHTRSQPYLSPGGHNPSSASPLAPPTYTYQEPHQQPQSYPVSEQPVHPFSVAPSYTSSNSYTPSSSATHVSDPQSHAYYSPYSYQHVPSIQLPDNEQHPDNYAVEERNANYSNSPSPSAASPGQLESKTPSRTNSGKEKPKSTFKCDIEGCTSNALFGRLADLQRHQTTVHSEDKPFPCTVHRCSRVGPRGFNRRDHLTEHLRSYHQQNIPKRSPGQRSAPQGFMGN